MSDKYLFIPYCLDIIDVIETKSLIIVDECQKAVMQKMIDKRLYNDGAFIPFDEISDLTEGG